MPGFTPLLVLHAQNLSLETSNYQGHKCAQKPEVVTVRLQSALDVSVTESSQ